MWYQLMCGYALYHVDETYIGKGFNILLNDIILRPLQERVHASGHNGLASGDRSATYGKSGGGPLYHIGYPNQPEKGHV